MPKKSNRFWVARGKATNFYLVDVQEFVPHNFEMWWTNSGLRVGCGDDVLAVMGIKLKPGQQKQFKITEAKHGK